MPFRIDLRHYATWLEGSDPFDEEPDSGAKTTRRSGAQRSLERFLVDYCHFYSGGRSVTLEEVQDLLERYPHSHRPRWTRWSGGPASSLRRCERDRSAYETTGRR